MVFKIINFRGRVPKLLKLSFLYQVCDFFHSLLYTYLLRFISFFYYINFYCRIALEPEPSMYCKSELVSFISDLPSKPKILLTSDSEIVVKLQSFEASHLVEFFSKIEEQYKDFGSDGFTISVSALEEIFSLLAGEL